jgi:hypothetical protein
VIGELLSRAAARAAESFQTDDPLVDSLVQYAARIQEHLFGRWIAFARSGVGCSIHSGRPGEPLRPCHSPAIGGCVCCRKPVCIDHTMVGADGVLLCRACVVKHIPQSQQQQPPPPPPAAQPDRRRLREHHLQVLRLEGNPGEEEIMAAFKELARLYHPDTVPEPERAAAHEQFVAVNNAKDFLLAELRRQAA